MSNEIDPKLVFERLTDVTKRKSVINLVKNWLLIGDQVVSTDRFASSTH